MIDQPFWMDFRRYAYWTILANLYAFMFVMLVDTFGLSR